MEWKSTIFEPLGSEYLLGRFFKLLNSSQIDGGKIQLQVTSQILVEWMPKNEVLGKYIYIYIYLPL